MTSDSQLDSGVFLEAERELRRREWVGAVFIALLALGSWFVVALFHDLFTGDAPAPDLLSGLGRLDWSAGVDSDLATSVVVGSVSFVAVVAIAAATTRPPAADSTVHERVGWRRWMERLASLSVLASLLSIVFVLTQIIHGPPGASILLGLFAVLGYALSSALTFRSDDVTTARLENAKAREEKVIARAASQFTDGPPKRIRLAGRLLGAAAVTAGAPALFAAWYGAIVGHGFLSELGGWLTLYAAASSLPMLSLAAYWSAWAVGSRVAMATASALFIALAFGMLVGLIALGVTFEGWWLALVPPLWLLLLAGHWRRHEKSVFAQVGLRVSHQAAGRALARLPDEEQNNSAPLIGRMS